MMMDICMPFTSTMIYIDKCGEATTVNGTSSSACCPIEKRACKWTVERLALKRAAVGARPVTEV
jgi:hypothetical protein